MPAHVLTAAQALGLCQRQEDRLGTGGVARGAPQLPEAPALPPSKSFYE